MMWKLLILGVFMILIGSTVVGFFEDLIFTIGCLGCKEGRDALIQDITDVVTAGQHDVYVGVEGLKELKTMPEGEIDEFIKEGLADTYRNKIILGSLMTAFYIFVVFFATNLIMERFLTGFWMTTIPGILFAVAVVGLLHMIFTGFTELPYQGWVHLAYNAEVMSAEFLEIISPVPPEALNQTLVENITGG